MNRKRTPSRPFVRTRRADQPGARGGVGTMSKPVFQPLEPRRLLTTLYANADPTQGQTNVFTGYIAMPSFFPISATSPDDLDASSVEERSVVVRIQITDSNPFSAASVTIVDLDGQPLFPWIGQPDGTGFTTELDFAVDPGEDGFWGTGDDETESGFGLDGGYMPGWRVAVDPTTGAFIPGVWVPDDRFHPVEQVEYDPEGDPAGWQPDSFTFDKTIVAPPTGYWHWGEDGIFNTGDDLRVPAEFAAAPQMPVGTGTDDRVLNTNDDPFWDFTNQIILANADPFEAPRDNRVPNPPTNMRHAHLVDMQTGVANDGIADFNNGIGQIIFSNTTATTRFTISIFDPETGEPITPFQSHPSEWVGIDYDPIAQEVVGGEQVPAFGQVIIGNPTYYDWRVDRPFENFQAFAPDGWQNFKYETGIPGRAAEGIFFANPSANETIGRISIDGALFGVSRFPAAVETIHVGYLGGAIFVDGELDSFIAAGDTGYIDYPTLPDGNTGAFIDVGRSAGTILSGGRMGAVIIVDGDFDPSATVDKPFLRSSQVIVEHEVTIHDADQLVYDSAFVSGSAYYILPSGGEGGGGGGEGAADYLINDTFGQAQYIGRTTSRITVVGTLGGTPQVGPLSGGDEIDIYAFAVDGETEVQMTLLNAFGTNLATLMTVQDEFGRIVASRGTDGTTGNVSFTPDSAGVYYIVIENSAGFGQPTTYQLVTTGIEGTTLGEVRSYGQLRQFIDAGTGIRTGFGDIGTIRVGQDAIEHGTAFISRIEIASAGSIWNITAGSGIGGGLDADGTEFTAPVLIAAAQHIGSIITGIGAGEQTGGAGGVRLGGSLVSGEITVGGNLGRVHAIGAGNTWGSIAEVNNDGGEGAPDGSVLFDVAGNIGVIRADNLIMGYNAASGAGTQIIFGDNGTIDLIEAGGLVIGDDEGGGVPNRDLTFGAGDAGIKDNPLFIDTQNRVGGNVRFVRAPFIYSLNQNSDELLISPEDGAVEFVDDSGTIFRIEVTAGRNTGGPSTSAARILTQPTNFSRGTSVARIEANLSFGAQLIITVENGTAEIGDIIVTGTTADSGNAIIMRGDGRLDVNYIRAEGTFELIENRTSGDIIAIDVVTLQELRINGNLGRTETVAFGPKLLGPRLGIAVQAPPEPAGEIGDPQSWLTGSTLFVSPDGMTIDDIDPEVGGAPFDSLLNGIVVRDPRANFPVELIEVGGAVGDVIIQNTVERIIVNADGVTAPGDFDGVVGTVYALGNIEYIEVGDGLIGPGSGPILIAGIGAVGQVVRVVAQGEGNNIEGIIAGVGFGFFPPALQDVEFGVGRIELRDGADLFNAIITTEGLDDFWIHPTAGDTGSGPNADIDRVDVRDGNMIDSVVRTQNLERLQIKNGYWDTSVVRAFDSVGRVEADRFIKTGDPADLNLIQASGQVERIEAKAGNIEDLDIDILGNLGSLRGDQIVGVNVDVDQFVDQVRANAGISRSIFIMGAVSRFEAQDDIDRITIETAGPIDRMRSKGGSIERIDLLIDGPDGRMGRLEAQNTISGSIRVSGPIDRIRTSTGDLNADITTFTGDGDINQIQTGRDMLATLDLDGNLGKLKIGRNFGDGGTLLVQGNLDQLDVRNGELNGSLIVQGAITKKFTVDKISSDSTITVRGGIARMDINDSLEGTITSHSDGIQRLSLNGTVGANAAVRAYSGAITKMQISGGDLLGTVIAEEGIDDLRVDGNFGGVIHSDTFATKIEIGGDTNGGRIIAVTTLDDVEIDGNVTNTLFGAGMLMDKIDIAGSVTNADFVGGLESVGNDGALGGFGLNVDRVTAGDIGEIKIGGSITDTVFAAGINPGSDGSFDPDTSLNANTDLAPGLSSILDIEVGGEALGDNVVVADTFIGSVEVNGIDRTIAAPGDGMDLREIDADPIALLGRGENQATFDENTVVTLVEADGDVISFSMSGPGQGIVEYQGAGIVTQIVFRGTTDKTDVNIAVVTPAGNAAVSLLDAPIQFDDDLSIGRFFLAGDLDGDDSFELDGNVRDLIIANVDGDANIEIGGEADSITLASVGAGAVLDVTHADNLIVSGTYAGEWLGESVGTVQIGGVMSGVFYARDLISNFNANSGINGGLISTRGTIERLNATSMNFGIVSAGNRIGSINVNGNVTDSLILAGFSLGSDGDFGGGGTEADRLGDGVIESVSIGGSMTRSSIAAGIDPGADLFFGTADDIVSLGLSRVGQVTVNGQAQGSNIFSQNYAITASGSVGSVRANGQTFFGNGNLEVEVVEATPIPVVVEDLDVRVEVNTFFVDLYFSQELDLSTLLANDPTNPLDEGAISIVSATGGTDPSLFDGDYTIRYFEAEQRVEIEFSRPFVVANPDVYEIRIDGTVLRSSTGVLLDGDEDGLPGGDYVSNVQIGDAGDRTQDGSWDYNGDTIDDVDFREAVDLDLILTNTNGVSRNREVFLAEQIGNHADHENLYFPAKMDADIYKVSLNEGEVFRVELNEQPGSAALNAVNLYAVVDGQQVLVATADTLSVGYIVGTTLEYYVVVTGGDPVPGDQIFGLQDFPLDIQRTDGMWAAVPPPGMPFEIDPDQVVDDTGVYELSFYIHDDGNGGFDRGDELIIRNGETTTVYGQLGAETNGAPGSSFLTDADVYDLRLDTVGGVVDELPEGATITVRILLEQHGSDLGPTAEAGLFLLQGGFADGKLVAAPGFTQGDQIRSADDLVFTVEVPEDGEYAIYIQGIYETDYSIQVSINTDTAGPRELQPRQNILIATQGGTAEWYGRFGIDLDPFSLGDLGFGGLESQVLNLMIQEIEDDFETYRGGEGVEVRVSLNPSDFRGEEFTTVFLANNYGDENFFASDFGAAEDIDPLNSDPSQEAIVFVSAFEGLFPPGTQDQLASALADQVSRQVGYTLGLRNNLDIEAAINGTTPSMMDVISGVTTNKLWQTADTFLNDSFYLGVENEADMLEWILQTTN